MAPIERRDSTRDMPPDSSDNHTTDELLSKSLMQLKFEDRNEIREELHGVRNRAREETPELINESLSKMNTELDSIISESQDNQFAFQKARCLEKTFVNDRGYRLKFLRSELFDAVKAADRMIAHLDFLLQLFGPRALEEPLKASFFDKEEAVALREGNVQLLPFRDRSGRRILAVLSGSLSYSPLLRVRKNYGLYKLELVDIMFCSILIRCHLISQIITALFLVLVLVLSSSYVVVVVVCFYI